MVNVLNGSLWIKKDIDLASRPQLNIRTVFPLLASGEWNAPAWARPCVDLIALFSNWCLDPPIEMMLVMNELAQLRNLLVLVLGKKDGGTALQPAISRHHNRQIDEMIFDNQAMARSTDILPLAAANMLVVTFSKLWEL